MNTHNTAIKPTNSIWQRGLYMLLFAFLIGVAKFVTFTVVVLQFILVATSGTANTQLQLFGQGLSIYTYQIMMFLTFNSETHPYPLSDWPDTTPDVNPPHNTERG